ncbi:methionyl-tRNA formyltransferase [Aestuariibacter sp. A3R04]|uniref:methionyl-tRNA formyltransferase n=1 Tax=Aestuariibacter sp. A3R04 TaxID=2841571 RepID=UPI001C084990|nr:methionyl-tRNA formyltransferase [Aestuariibacter sp. A3R04]
MKSPLKIIFAGTPDFAADHLKALLDSAHEVVAVYTQPDRPAGRGKKLTASPVKVLAEAEHIPVYQPQSLKTKAAQDELASIDADIMVVVAFGLILPQVVLDTPKYGCLNVHGSILPKWRGAAPIQRAIWAGDKDTGVTIMQMDAGLDTGDMLHVVKVPIADTETSASLYTKLAACAPAALLEVLNDLPRFTDQAEPQDSRLATYANKLSKEEALIDWSQPSEQIERNIRAFNPWPVAWMKIGVDNVKVWDARILESTSSSTPGVVVKADKHGIVVSTGSCDICLTQLQIPGKKSLPAADVLNARPQWFIVGQVIGSNY